MADKQPSTCLPPSVERRKISALCMLGWKSAAARAVAHHVFDAAHNGAVALAVYDCKVPSVHPAALRTNQLRCAHDGQHTGQQARVWRQAKPCRSSASMCRDAMPRRAQVQQTNSAQMDTAGRLQAHLINGACCGCMVTPVPQHHTVAAYAQLPNLCSSAKQAAFSAEH